MPQEIALYEDLTAREKLIFWGQMYGLSGKSLNSRVDEVLEQIGLVEKAKNKVKTYDYLSLHQQWVTDAQSKWFISDDFD